MSKVIIDGKLIDLEMVTYISLPTTGGHSDCSYFSFTISFIGGKNIEIWREFNLQNKDDVMEKVDAMFTALCKRWSPSMLKFDDLTVK